MSNKTISGMKCILYLLGLLVMGSTDLFAEEMADKNIALDIRNIGFEENPPKELKEKFPMCDAFLKVEWIDKEKKVGYSHFDFYIKGKKRGQMTALVYISQFGASLRMDLYKYQRDGTLQAIFAFIKDGKIVESKYELSIRQGKKEIAFFPAQRDFTLSERRQTVCVPYPDGQRMWIAEMKQVGIIYSDQEIEKKYAILKQSFPMLLLPMFKKWSVIDLNFDGVDDYDYFGPIYSFGDNYFEPENIGGGYHREELSFPPTGKTCELKGGGGHYLTTDGKSYFLGNQCNLTELTKGDK